MAKPPPRATFDPPPTTQFFLSRTPAEGYLFSREML
jgi:hypothetical protein